MAGGASGSGKEALGKPFEWTITDVSSLPETRICSPVFESGGKKWRLAMWPHGKPLSRDDTASGAKSHMSLYVSAVETDKGPRATSWCRRAKLRLSVGRPGSEGWHSMDLDHVFLKPHQYRGFDHFVSRVALFEKFVSPRDTIVVSAASLPVEPEPAGAPRKQQAPASASASAAAAAAGPKKRAAAAGKGKSAAADADRDADRDAITRRRGSGGAATTDARAAPGAAEELALLRERVSRLEAAAAKDRAARPGGKRKRAGEAEGALLDQLSELDVAQLVETAKDDSRRRDALLVAAAKLTAAACQSLGLSMEASASAAAGGSKAPRGRKTAGARKDANGR